MKPVHEAIIFDIDNVLIDTRKSYHEAIRQTIDIYLSYGDIPLFTKAKADPLLLSTQDIDRFKLLGGFNDDWDCCYGLLVYLLTLPLEKRTFSELRKKIDFPGFFKKFAHRPVGVHGIVKHFGRSSHVKIEKIERIFQEVYLGQEVFRMTEKKNPIYWKKRGLIAKEKLIFKKKTLEKLNALGFRLGIATGRSRFEAAFGLKMFGVLDLFEAMTTSDEVKEAEQAQKRSLRKPHPFSLVETAKKLGEKNRFFYVGDLPDDVLAANRAKEFIAISSIAFLRSASDVAGTMAELKKNPPDFIIRKPSELFSLLHKARKNG